MGGVVSNGEETNKEGATWKPNEECISRWRGVIMCQMATEKTSKMNKK